MKKKAKGRVRIQRKDDNKKKKMTTYGLMSVSGGGDSSTSFGMVSGVASTKLPILSKKLNDILLILKTCQLKKNCKNNKHLYFNLFIISILRKGNTYQ